MAHDGAEMEWKQDLMWICLAEKICSQTFNGITKKERTFSSLILQLPIEK
jgi:hypothetical protein